MITPGIGSFTDSGCNAWTITAPGVVQPNGHTQVVNENGAAAGTNYDVILGLWYGGVPYQENLSHQWFGWNGTSWGSVAGDPRNAACISRLATVH
jgi:hypothetical protein